MGCASQETCGPMVSFRSRRLDMYVEQSGLMHCAPFFFLFFLQTLDRIFPFFFLFFSSFPLTRLTVASLFLLCIIFSAPSYTFSFHDQSARAITR